MSRGQSLVVGSRDFAHQLMSMLTYEIENSRISDNLYHICTRYIREDERNIINEAMEQFRGYNTVFPHELEQFVRQLTPLIIDEADRIEQERIRHSRGRNGYRDGYGYNNDPYARPMRDNGHFPTRRTNNTGVKSGYGARYDNKPLRDIHSDRNWHQPSDFQNQNIPTQQERSKVAAEASQRNISEIKSMATNQPMPEPVIVDVAPVDVGGVHNDRNYTVIGSNDDNKTITFEKVSSPELISNPNNSVYTNTEKHYFSMSTGETIVKSVFKLNQPVCKIKTAWDIIIQDNPTLYNPDAYVYVVTVPKLFLLKSPGNTIDILKYADDIKIATNDNTVTLPAKLANISRILSETPDTVRKAYRARIMSKWNRLACCNLVSPSNPARSLQLQDLSSLVDTLNSCSNFTPESEAYKVFKNQVNSDAYAMAINHCATRALSLAFGNRPFGNGYLEITKDNINYLSSFDELPIVVGNTKRSRDIITMTDNEKDEYIGEFNKNYICCMDYEDIIVTNLPVDQLMIHPRINCITAKDNPTVAILKSIIDRKAKAEAVFTVNGGWKYIGDVGLAGNDLMFTRLLTIS